MRQIMKSGFIDKLVDRLNRIDPGSLQTHFLRLASEKGLLEAIFHAIQEGIIVLDDRGCVSYANRAAGHLLGFSLESALGNPIRRYLREIDWDRALDLDEKEWSRLVSREIEIRYPERRFLDFYIVPLSVVSAREKGAVLIFRDISRDREQEAQAIESERLNALTLLAAGVAHEIGNPLNSLNIHLQLIDRELEQLPEKDRQNLRELLEVSKKEVTRLDHIINQFLRAIRPSQPQFEKTSILEVLRDTIDFLKHEIKDRNVMLEIETSGELPMAQIDRNQIKQAFFNVIKNAVEAMPHGGSLKVVLSSTDRFIVIAFKDSGPGIDPKDLGHIFDAYHTTKSKGSGLGLMIVQRIVREHGGLIEVHSEPQRGTTFTLFLPRDEQRIRLLKAHRAAAQTAAKERDEKQADHTHCG